MKTVKFLQTLFTFVIVIAACTENDPEVVTPQEEQPEPTMVGIPVGIPVTKTIGADGGTLSTVDGTLQLTVPAGAVNAATIFTIQAISNHCPGGSGMAYRLSPEGITFSQPVLLNFSYTNTLVAYEKFFGLAYQGTDNTWLAPKEVSLNEADNKIIIETKHFSDWSLFLRLSLEPLSATVKINENIELKCIFVDELHTISSTELNHLNSRTVFTTWQAASGTIVQYLDAADSTMRATYTAPSAVPSPNPVEVSVTFNNVSFTQNGATFNNPKLKANIKVVGEDVIFLVEFTSSRPLQPVGNSWFTETDKGFMKVAVNEDSVTVYDIQNVNAEVLPGSLYDPSPECTHTLLSAGDGPYHVANGVSFGGIYHDNQVYVGINGQTVSNGATPSFQISCTGSLPSLTGGEKLPTAPSHFSFDATKEHQETVQIIPGGGAFPDGYLKIAVTRVSENGG